VRVEEAQVSGVDGREERGVEVIESLMFPQEVTRGIG